MRMRLVCSNGFLADEVHLFVVTTTKLLTNLSVCHPVDILCAEGGGGNVPSPSDEGWWEGGGG